MFLKQIYDESLAQYAYLIGCQRSGEALLIDPERDIDRYLEIAEENELRITAVAETHIHADFISGSREFLETQDGVRAYLSDMGDADWKYAWAEGREDVVLLRGGDTFHVGKVEITAVHTPGHTPEHLVYLIEDHGAGADEPIAVASGDFIFVGDVGRPDLLESAAGQVGAREPAARVLYESLQMAKGWPEFLQILPGHGAGSACGKALGAVPTSTVGYECRFNEALRQALRGGREAFVDTILEGQPEPPIYFARMKRVNKEGPDLVSHLPAPIELGAETLRGRLDDPGTSVLDLRRDKLAFIEQHLRGSLYTPFGPNLSAVAGSYVAPEQDIVLVLEGVGQLDEAIRSLLRIGLDRIVGYVTIPAIQLAEPLQSCFVSLPRITGKALSAARTGDADAEVLDVRRGDERVAAAIPDSLHIAHTRLAEHLGRMDRGRHYLVHCASGGRATYAAAYLSANGFKVTVVDGDAVGDCCDGAVEAESATVATTAG